MIDNRVHAHLGFEVSPIKLLRNWDRQNTPNAVLVFQEYLKVKEEIVAVLNNLDILVDRATALMSSED